MAAMATAVATAMATAVGTAMATAVGTAMATAVIAITALKMAIMATAHHRAYKAMVSLVQIVVC